MAAKAMVTLITMLACTSFAQDIAFVEHSEPSEKQTQDFRQELDRIMTTRESFTLGPTNDLDKYEKFVDEIQHKWSKRNKELYARLMVYACGPLSSGRFKDRRQYELARKYALSILENPDEIPLFQELDLTGYVMTSTVGPKAPKEEDFAERRRKDVQIRFHAWKRLMDAVDPNWDPEDLPHSNIEPPAATGLPGGVVPEAIKNANLRAEYEAAIERNRKKAIKYIEQRKVRDWLKRFPTTAESYIIQAYLHTPYNLEELRKMFNDYGIDGITKARILDAVINNIDKDIAKE